MRKSATLVTLSLLLALQQMPARADVTPDERQAVSDQMQYQLQQQYGSVQPIPPEQKAAQVFQSLLPYVRRHDVHYRISVVQSRDINAYSMPDGRVVLYSNLLRHIQNDPNALAFTEAHEISHIESLDADHKIETALGSAVLLGFMVRRATFLEQLAALATHQIVNSGYSRQLETNADLHGMELMQKAGYDPNGALVVFRMFEKMEGQGLRVFPNHPRAVDRYNNAVAWLEANHIAVRDPNVAAAPPPPVQPYYPPPVPGVGTGQPGAPSGTQMGAHYAPAGPLPLPAINYSTLTPSQLSQGVFDAPFESALKSELIGRLGQQYVVDSHLSAKARTLTGTMLQSEVQGSRTVIVAMVPGTWQFQDWQPDLEQEFLPFIQQQSVNYNAIGYAVKSNAGGTKQIILLLGHL